MVCWPINPSLDLSAAASDAQGQQNILAPMDPTPSDYPESPGGGVLTQSDGSPAFLITQILFVTYHCFLSWGFREHILFCFMNFGFLLLLLCRALIGT